MLKYRTKNLIFFLFVFTSCSESARKYLSNGATAYHKKEYAVAIKQLSRAQEKGIKEQEEVNYMLAESYRLSNQLAASQPFYKALLDSKVYGDRALFWYASSLKANGEYEESLSHFVKYAKQGTDRDKVLQSKREFKKLTELKRIDRIPRHWDIDHSLAINSPGPEYGLSIHKDTIYLTMEGNKEFIYQGQGTAFTDIYYLPKDELGTGKPKPMNSKINLPNVHEACPAISPDGKTLIFARSNTGKKKDPISQVDLYKSKKIFDQWTAPVQMELNKRGAWTSTPTYAPDNKTIYFSSDRAGGRGGKDLWRAEWDDLNDRFINIVNLGPKINTAGDEMFPYIDPKGDFYFASDGHAGYGRLDLFKVKNFGKSSQRAINMGRPMNSEADDFGILFTTDSSGFYSSDRKGGQGFDDVYSFIDTLPDSKFAFYFLKAIVKGKVLSDSNTITNQLVELPFAQVSLADDEQLEIGLKKTDENASATFEVETEKEYSLLVAIEGYLKRRVYYSTVNKTVPQQALTQKEQDIFFTTEIILDPLMEDLIVDFDPIYFEYNKWDVTKEAEHVLQEMLTVLRDNPNISVEIGSHTDPRGNDKFNETLSAKRAKSVVEFMISKGISQQRISYKGYGETVPYQLTEDIGALKKGAVLTHDYILTLPEELQEEAYRLDRRTEFKITEVLR